jgi:hypothetical protein
MRCTQQSPRGEQSANYSFVARAPNFPANPPVPPGDALWVPPHCAELRDCQSRLCHVCQHLPVPGFTSPFVRLQLSLIEPASVQPYQSAQACARHYLPHLPLLRLPAANRSLAVRGSHVSRELLQHIAPPRSSSHHRIRLPGCPVSAPRDSKAGDLPGVMLHHATDYWPTASNGSMRFQTASFLWTPLHA